MDRLHPLAQVVGQVADGIKLGVPGLAAGIQVRKLGDRTTAEDADPQDNARLWQSCDFPRITLPQRLAKRGQILAFGQSRQRGQMLLDREYRSARPIGGRRSPAASPRGRCAGRACRLCHLIVLIAEPARNKTFCAIPLDSRSWRFKIRLPWSSAPARVIMVGLMPATGRVSASSEARHSAP